MSDKKTLNDQMADLDKIVNWFDQANIDLDEALKKFDEGIKLAEQIKKRLAEAENKINVIKQRFDQERV